MIAFFSSRLGLSTLAFVGLAALAGVSISASTAEQAHRILPPAYVLINDLPKIQAVKRLFSERYEAGPVLVADAGHASGCLMCRE
jgi:hypothetical protein